MGDETLRTLTAALAIIALMIILGGTSAWGGAHDVTTAPALVRHADPIQAVGR